MKKLLALSLLLLGLTLGGSAWAQETPDFEKLAKNIEGEEMKSVYKNTQDGSFETLKKSEYEKKTEEEQKKLRFILATLPSLDGWKDGNFGSDADITVDPDKPNCPNPEIHRLLLDPDDEITVNPYDTKADSIYQGLSDTDKKNTSVTQERTTLYKNCAKNIQGVIPKLEKLQQDDARDNVLPLQNFKRQFGELEEAAKKLKEALAREGTDTYPELSQAADCIVLETKEEVDGEEKTLTLADREFEKLKNYLPIISGEKGNLDSRFTNGTNCSAIDIPGIISGWTAVGPKDENGDPTTPSDKEIERVEAAKKTLQNLRKKVEDMREVVITSGGSAACDPAADCLKKLTDAREKNVNTYGKKIQFLNNRFMEIRLHEMMIASGKFDVTGTLRATENSREGELTLIGGDSQTNLFDKVIRLFAQIIGTFAILMLVVSAIYFIIAQGNEQQLQRGKQIFLYTVFGLVIAFAAYALVQLFLDLLLW